MFYILNSTGGPSGNDLYNNRALNIARKLEKMTSRRNLMIRKEILEYPRYIRLVKIKSGDTSMNRVIIEECFSSERR